MRRSPIRIDLYMIGALILCLKYYITNIGTLFCIVHIYTQKAKIFYEWSMHGSFTDILKERLQKD